MNPSFSDPSFIIPKDLPPYLSLRRFAGLLEYSFERSISEFELSEFELNSVWERTRYSEGGRLLVPVAEAMSKFLGRDAVKALHPIVRGYAWSQAYFEEAELRRLYFEPGLKNLTVGYLDSEVTESRFGLILDFVSNDSLLGFARSFLGAFGHLPYAGSLQGHFLSSIPVFLRFSNERLDSLPHPFNGTSTCWASYQDQVCVLTAKHCFDSSWECIPPGKQILYTDPQSSGEVKVGYVLASCPGHIDGAVFSVDKTPLRKELREINTTEFLAPFEPIKLHFKGSTMDSCITSVGDTRGTFGPFLPAKFYIANHGKPGDSGALVSTRGHGVGIYQGRLESLASTSEGFVQNLFQVQKVLKLLLYTKIERQEDD